LPSVQAANHHCHKTVYLHYRNSNTISLSCDVTLRRFVVIDRRLGTTYPSLLQGSSVTRTSSWTALPSNMVAIGCGETSVTKYQSTLSNTSGEQGSQLYCDGNPKSRHLCTLQYDTTYQPTDDLLQ